MEKTTATEKGRITAIARTILDDMRIQYSLDNIEFELSENSDAWKAYNNKFSADDTYFLEREIGISLTSLVFNRNLKAIDNAINDKINKLAITPKNVKYITNFNSILSLLIAIGLDNGRNFDIREINSIVFTTNEIIKWIK